MTVRIRIQFDNGSELLDLDEMPRIGEALIMPIQLDPVGPVKAFRVTDVAHYPVRATSNEMMQRADVRVAGTLKDGPRQLYSRHFCQIRDAGSS